MVGHDAIADGDKKMRLRYAGTCRLCGVGLPARTEAVYERGTKTVRCVDCSAGESSAARVGAEPVPPA